MNATNVAIAFEEKPRLEDSLALRELLESLAECDIASKPEIDPAKVGVKDGGLMVGLTIAALAVSAIGTVISAISLWGSKRNYSISFESGGATFAANNLNAKETMTIAHALRDKALSSDIKVLVSLK